MRAGTVGAVSRPLLVVLALALLAACTSGDSGGGDVLEGSFEKFDGSTGSFADYRGRPVVVNFFSSTCVPCVTEMPAFERVHRDVGEQVVFLGMNVQDTLEGGKAFAESVGITWELGRDPVGAILRDELGGVGLPTTVLLDRDGRIVFKKLGPLDAADLTLQLDKHGFIQ